MMKSLWFDYLILHVIFCLLSTMPLTAQNKPIPVADRLYQFINIHGGNAVFLVTEKEVVIVDAGTYPSDGRKMIEQIASVTDKPVRYVILTHYHMDHTGGLAQLPSSATVIGHQNITAHLKRNEVRIQNALKLDLPTSIDELKKNIESYKQNNDTNLAKTEKKLKELEHLMIEMRDARVIYPSLTFDSVVTLYLGRDTIRLIHPSPAHTRCNLLVHFVNQKALHTGDMLFNGRFPYIMWADGSNTKNWIEALEQTLAWDLEIVIPGHGDRTDKSGIQKKIHYLKTLRSVVSEAITKGLSLEEMQNQISLPQYKHLESPHRLKQNIESVYKEMTGKEP